MIGIAGGNGLMFLTFAITDPDHGRHVWPALFYFIIALLYVTLYLYTKTIFVARWASLTISQSGITSFSRFGRIDAAWDDITRVKAFAGHSAKPFLLHFETNKGDFLVYKWGFPRFRQFVDTVKGYAGDRVVPMEGSKWKLNTETTYECSHCGGQFVAIACPFCEVPRTKRPEPARTLKPDQGAQKV